MKCSRRSSAEIAARPNGAKKFRPGKNVAAERSPQAVEPGRHERALTERAGKHSGPTTWAARAVLLSLPTMIRTKG